MMLASTEALHWTAWITGAAIAFQTLELISIRKVAHDSGVWNWKIVREDFIPLPYPVRVALDGLLSYRGFLLVLAFRLICAVAMALTLSALAAAIVFVTTLLISLRWRGSFNGGSDFMNLIVLSALCVAFMRPSNAVIVAGCLWYIAIQTCTSYFIAGTIKIRRENWRNGAALSGFLNSTIYSPDPAASLISKNHRATMLTSWGVMIFECAFPIALLNSQLCLTMIAVAALFHLANFYFFGLNRFVLSWAAAYPALLFCSQLKL